jgi:hypothetical protein
MGDVVTRLRAMSEWPIFWRSGDSARNILAREAADEIERLRAWKEKVIDQARRDEDSICQDLGRALGFPWYKDDPANFPNATEADGVCVGDLVGVVLAEMAADKIAALRAEIAAKDEALAQAGWLGNALTWGAAGTSKEAGDKLLGIVKAASLAAVTAKALKPEVTKE